MWEYFTDEDAKEAEVLVEESLADLTEVVPARIMRSVRAAMVEELLCSEDGRAIVAMLRRARLQERKLD
ncbi:MAG: hypothetical protein HOW73_18225 [Polyangiaceae bacterium]|nr:hypothetical protein [Polyangiaceae bacterium]